MHLLLFFFLPLLFLLIRCIARGVVGDNPSLGPYNKAPPDFYLLPVPWINQLVWQSLLLSWKTRQWT